MWLLDTVTLSETIKVNANPAVIQWIDSKNRTDLYTSAICIGEIRYGMERLPPGLKKDGLRLWIERRLEQSLQGRVVPLDVGIAKTWAELRSISPRTLPVLDSLIAATALARGLIVVTRNAKDFEAFGVEVFNPWPDN
jgi:toxin FitB